MDTFETKVNEIINFISKNTKEKIEIDLLKLLRYNKFCPNIIGEGYFGLTYTPSVDKLANGKYPVIIKEAKRNEGWFDSIIINNILYIYSYDNMNVELLNMIYLKKLREKIIHLPMLFGYGTCKNNKVVDKLISLRYGLNKNIKINIKDKYYNWDYVFREQIREMSYENNLSTIEQLFNYIKWNKKPDNSIVFPNGKKCNNISELFDSICISYLATHQFLNNHNIFPDDMHKSNVFIDWESCKNVDEIYYKVNTKYYKIKCYGFVIVLGDVGMFNMKIKKDVYTIGHAHHVDSFNLKVINLLFTPELTAADFMYNIQSLISVTDFHNTVFSKIIKSEPYCSRIIDSYGVSAEYIKKLKGPIELLKFFDEKYRVNKCDKKDLCFHI